ncbi:MAG TPA: winged helix-turn-helix domain-containing protein [Candidatus Acidoferrum sp.]|nr:winged helix-turn-helix domain-containing protein [Candidatus Acidoferrum sp.]
MSPRLPQHTVSPGPPTVRFGGIFELRPRARELYRDGIRLKLRPQPFRVLEILVENAGEVVTREEFQKQLWPSDTFVDFEHGLNSSVKSLRAVLGDCVQEPRYIETIPKIGYRFIATVQAAEDSGVHLLPAEGVTPETQAAPQATPGASFAAAPAQSLRRWIAAAALLAAALLSVTGYWWRHSRVPAFQPTHVMMAVLPFENLTGDPNQEFVTDGLTEEIISRLGQADPAKVSVIARTSVMQYKHSSQQIQAIAQKLGAQYLLKGTLRRDLENVRITANLIRVSDRVPVWSHEYQRASSSLNEVQQEIAVETADAIFLALGDQKRAESVHAAPAISQNQSDAYLHYLKGRYFWNRRTEQGFELAIREFQSAIDKQPAYAQAYAGLADSYNLSASYGFVSPQTFMPKARVAALRAVELNESLAEAHTSLAAVAQNYDWDWSTAEKEYRRAIELNPNYATAHHWYAECLALQGRFDEAFAEIGKARELDPLSLIIAADYGAILYFSRQYGPAIQQFHTVLEMDPDFSRAQMITYAYVEEGRFPEAVQVVDRWKEEKNAPWGWPMSGYIYGRWGKQGEAQQAFQETMKLNRAKRVEPTSLILLSIAMGNRKEALDWLEKACAERTPNINAIKVDPTYDPLRNEPRFHAVLKQIHLE